MKESFYAKALYGALILRGDVPKEEKMTGMVLLQESSNYGFAISKLILGMTYLDGVDISYNCPKAINHIREGLLSVDLWAVRVLIFRTRLKRPRSPSRRGSTCLL